VEINFERLAHFGREGCCRPAAAECESAERSHQPGLLHPSNLKMAESQLSTEQQVKSIWYLGGQTPWQMGKAVYREIGHDNIPNQAAALAYNFLMSVFPLLLAVLALLGMFAQHTDQVRNLLFNLLPQVLPASASDLLSKTVGEIMQASGGGKLTFGIVFGLYSASGGTSTMMSVLDGSYHVQENRPYWKQKVIALALTIVLVALLTAALLIVLFGGGVANHLANNGLIGPMVKIALKIIGWLAALFFMFLAFATIYYWGPDVKEQHWYWITPGSMVGVTLWVVASLAFRLYLHFFNSYSKSYGSLGAVIILMLWFYVTGFAFLIGGVINAEIEHAAAERGHPEAKAPGEKKAA
jgi:membrane protein